MLPVIFISAIFRILILSDYQFIKSVNVAGEMHYSDPIGNVYVVSSNTLKKFSTAHVQAAVYTNTFLGNIHSVDVSDPLRILLFYKDYNQIIWVDNFLSEIRSPVWLDALGIDQVELVCSSSQGGFWVFNSLNNQLQYFDVQLQFVHESPTLNILTGPDISPTFMIEKSRLVYLNVPGTGILVFDRFGNYSKTLPVDVASIFQVTDNYLYYMKDGELYSYDLQTAEFAIMELPGSGEPILNDISGHGEPVRTEISGSLESATVNYLHGNEIMKAELQPGFLFLFTRKGYSVYKTNH